MNDLAIVLALWAVFASGFAAFLIAIIAWLEHKEVKARRQADNVVDLAKHRGQLHKCLADMRKCEKSVKAN